METIERIELRQVKAGLDSEVQSRLQLEQKLEAIQMASREAENNRRNMVNEHEEALRYRITYNRLLSF